MSEQPRRVSLREAVEAFDANQVSDIEYGINDEDAATCLRGMFTALGIEWDEDCLFLYGRIATAEQIAESEASRRRSAERTAAWRLANPQSAALSDRIQANLDASQAALIERILADVFKPSPFFRFLQATGETETAP